MNVTHHPPIADADASNANDVGSKGMHVSTICSEKIIRFESPLGQFVGSLYEPWMRNRNNATTSSYIEAFLAVQVRKDVLTLKAAHHPE
jgi:hypothetical protein